MNNSPWLQYYPAGVPATIDINQYSSIVALLEESFRLYKERPAYVCMDKAITYGDIDILSTALGAWLQSRGLQRNDRVAVMLPNVLQYPVAVAAILRAGFIVVNVNPLYTPRELEHQLRDADVQAIIILENFASTLEETLQHVPVRHILLASMGDMLGTIKGRIVNYVVRKRKKMVPAYALPGAVRFNDAIRLGRTLALQRPDIKVSDVAVLQYTGGTTGVSKGATLLHGCILANLLSTQAWMQHGLDRKPIDGQLTLICALPLYHVFAFVTCGLLGMRTGGLVVLIPNPRDIPATVKTLSKYPLQFFPAVNTLFNALADNAEFARLDFSQLSMSVGGGTSVHESVAQKWLKITGCPIAEGYGLSETASAVICNPATLAKHSGTIGMPMPGVEVRLLDDDGADAAAGEPGEIALRGPQVMQGYWQRPQETADAMTPDGYFKTGDVGVMDQRGFFRIVDRKKDMILVSGFNVYPNEIEEVVGAHPDVLECAVIGLPDQHSGEAVKLFVVKRNPALSAEALKEYCSHQLTGYKRPKQIEFIAELPKTNVGKILRRQLRDQKSA
ncbi:long-chain-fatty-acid--CoA ligase [Herminiimonas sp. CN]|uniref:long-chain-fatty-acid--CoA ligase n=1 Tax=Herminiimonas sp. CN TaxID=1349818 RepID=UPI0004735443|nr:long-chain-fatty-acid--CoA ligase [Herminiimonas sp. CN]